VSSTPSISVLDDSLAAGTPQRGLVSRRRLLLLAVAAPLVTWRLYQGAPAAPLRWEGLAMGAPASLTLYHGGDTAGAQAALDATLAEINRLEAMFSLFRANSLLSELNRTGRLNNAPSEFLTLLRVALDMAVASKGVFDPSIQPLWTLYYDHFVVAGNSQPPAVATVELARTLVGWRGVHVSGADVKLARDGMGLSLNGVAQGFITDRCSDVLRAHGFSHMLVDMGEPRAVAPKPDGSAWQIGLADPRDPKRTLHTLSVMDQAVATSGGYGTMLDAAGLYTHLINPRTGQTAPAFESVSVVAPGATQADALSTALALIPHTDVSARLALLHTQPGCRAICIDSAGQVSELS
jgi:FAD:protein FMN transferase